MAKTHKRVTNSVFLVIDPEVCCYEIIVYLHKNFPEHGLSETRSGQKNVDTYSNSHNFGADLKCPKTPEKSCTHTYWYTKILVIIHLGVRTCQIFV